MAKIYLAINYGAYEGWKLGKYNSPQEALQVIKAGGTYGQEWKILKELELEVIDPNEDEKK